jgi:asparagine synthase (glutamine-hydrolysing)
MTGALRHRGPEGQNIKTLSAGLMQAGLGHARLKIIDLSDAAAQPMSNEDGSIWLAFNGEIYNFRELRSDLERRGIFFRTSSDTEVILRLYEAIGKKCLEQLDGMFAFAIWDARKRQLFLARDRLGKKPLFYYHNRRIFAFASEIKALLRNPSIPCEIFHSAIPHYFTFGYAPSPSTFYRDIMELPPAHCLTVDLRGQMELSRYWDLDFSQPLSREPSLEEAALTVRDLLTRAVQKRLVADVPLGAFLSGGVDSSIVVCLMSRLMQKPVKTFSIGFAGDRAFDETHYARVVADHFKTDHTEFIVEPKAIDLVEPLIWHHDGPFGDSSAIPTYIVAQLAREHVTVALSGDGGDELFAGYQRFYAAVLSDQLPRVLWRLGDAAFSRLPEPKSYHHSLRRVQRFLSSASYPFFDRYARWISLFTDDLPLLLRPEIFNGSGSAGISFPAEVMEKTSSFSPLSKLLYVNMRTYLYQDLLVKMDRTTMAHGLEARSPFLDQELMEYTATLPDWMKLRRGRTKYVLKRAFSGLIPSEILKRGKRGFGVPLGAWFRGELRDYVQDLLLSSDSKSRDYLNPITIRQMVREHLEGHRDHGQRLWAILTFEVWLRLLPQWAARPKAPFLSLPDDIIESRAR